jgi:hypothetical protein
MYRRFHALTAIVYLTIGVAAFAPVLTTQFVSDDWDFLIIVAHARSALVAFQPLVGRFVRPLVVLTYYVNYKLFGLWTFPYHLTVVLLHVLSAWLVCLLAERVDGRRRRSVGFAAGLLFLLFAGHSEAVSWVAGVADPLQTPLVIGALLCLGAALERDRPMPFVVLGWMLFAGALLAKETAAVFPGLALAFLLLETWRATNRRRALHRTLVFVTGPVVLVASLFVVRSMVFGATFGAYAGLGTSQGHGLIEAAVFLLRTFAPPVPLAARAWVAGAAGGARLNPALGAAIVAVGAAVAVVAAAGLARCRDRAAVVFALAAVVIALVPVLPLTISLTSTESERLVYVPSVFSSMLIVLAVAGSVGARSVGAAILAGMMLVNLVALERSNRIWREGGVLLDGVLHSAIALLRQHDPAAESLVFVLNIPDTLRGTYVLRNGFVSALRLLAPDRDLKPIRVIAVASQSTRDIHGHLTAFQTAPLEVELDLHEDVLFRQPPLAHPFFTFRDWTPHGYTIQFAPAVARALVLHMSEGRMNLTTTIQGPGLPFGSLEIPADGTLCEGATLRFAGWALDDEDVTRIVASRDAFAGEGRIEGQIEMGTAIWVSGTRPDVAAVFAGVPNANRSEWDYLLPCAQVGTAPDRSVTVHITAFDRQGHRVELGVRTIRGGPRRQQFEDDRARSAPARSP